MRDIKRIKALTDKLQELWYMVPDYRFGQLLIVICDSMHVRDIFFPEEDVWMKAIQDSIDNLKG